MAELILTFAHTVTTSDVFYSIAETTAEVISRIDTPEQEASSFPSELPCRVRVRPVQQILFVAGSKRMVEDTRGIEREIWDQQWSYGESVFSRVVKRVGLERFSPRAPTPLVAHLVGTMDTPSSTRLDLEGVVRAVACECLSILRLKKDANPISRIIVILPLEVGNGEPRMDEAAVSKVRETLNACWLGTDSPMQGVPMSFEFV